MDLAYILKIMKNTFSMDFKSTHRRSRDMIRLDCFLVFSFLIFLASNSIGLEWVTINSGDSIPPNAIRINDGGHEYIGRARHYDEILVAAANSTVAVVSSCGQQIAKRYYDVLVSRNACRWETFSHIEKVSENIVRAGTASNGEPIYIGRTKRTNNVFGIEPIYLLTKSKNQWPANSIAALVCNDNTNWIDTEVTKIPNNTVEGGFSAFGKRLYVARLKLGCSIIPGCVIPEIGAASAEYRDEIIFSQYCQVLVGDKNEYKWQSSLNGQIPDYAIVSSRDKIGELMYIARWNYTLGYLTQSAANKLNMPYEILVKNPQYYD